MSSEPEAGASLLCVICRTGELRRGRTTASAHVGDVTVIVRDVPADVCTRCGEAYYDGPTLTRLHSIQREALR